MDIRSFFTPREAKAGSGQKQTQKSSQTLSSSGKKRRADKCEDVHPPVKKKVKEGRKVIDSDSDEEPLPSKIRKSKTTKKVAVIEVEDSDDGEEVIIKKSGKNLARAESGQSKTSSKSEPPQLIATTASAYFGSESPVAKSGKTSQGKGKVKGDVKAEEKTEVKISPGKRKNVNEDSKGQDEPSKSRNLGTKESKTKTTPANKLSSFNYQKKEEKPPIESKQSPKKELSGSPKKAGKDRKVVNQSSSPSKLPTPEKKAKKSPEAESLIKDTPELQKKKSGYLAFRQREGPSAIGSKDIPEGAENCLHGLTFVITGVLESIEREDAVDLVQKHGGKVTQAVSGKTSYLVIGRDAGASKIDKAKKHNTKQIDEDGLFDLIRTSKGKEEKVTVPEQEEHLTKAGKRGSRPEEVKDRAPSSKKGKPESSPLTITESGDIQTDVLMWVDKYKPTDLKGIVGQQGEKSNANKLKKWLMNWWHHHGEGKKPKGGYFSGKEDGSIFKAALLSGPPGVGKTTTATLVCKDMGVDFTELNASDSRGKKVLQNVVAESVTNTTVDGYLKGKKPERNHALIMDEVDGMAGNEDRGGMQELIAIIKRSKIPIICMCNDRSHPKVRSLANYCFDLRFYKPRVEQIKALAMKVAFREGLKIPGPAIEQIITGANQDIRQVLHNMQMWTAKEKSMDYEQAKAEARNAAKNMKIGPFEVVRKLFSFEGDKLSIPEKTDMFFEDYSFIPLFVQENYLLSQPAAGRGNIHKTLHCMSTAADSISDSDLVDKLIRKEGKWSMLPLQAVFSCVIPPDAMRGGLQQRIEFPSWLGKNSSRGKHDRILQELQTHMKTSSLSSKSDINLDYLWILRRNLIHPLVKGDDDTNACVQNVISLMEAYDLSREDFDSIMELNTWNSEGNPAAAIPSKVKAAFTRAYNKGGHLMPYAQQKGSKKSRKGAGGGGEDDVDTAIEEGDEGLAQPEGSESEEDGAEEFLVKGKGRGGKKSAPSSQSESGKGKGKGKGKAKR